MFRLSKHQSHIYGIINGAARGIEYFLMASAIVLGGYLVQKGEIEYQNLFK